MVSCFPYNESGISLEAFAGKKLLPRKGGSGIQIHDAELLDDIVLDAVEFVEGHGGEQLVAIEIHVVI